MEQIDRTKNYFLVVDTETTNSIDDAIVYDYAYAVADSEGNIYERASFIVYDTFILERELMQSAYYAEKIPQYEKDLALKARRLVTFETARKLTKEVMENYGITKVWAYNARFDKNSLNTTMRYLTKSQFRYFFPKGTEFCCIWSVACQTICQTPEYFKFAENNNYITKGRIKTSAEVVHRFLTGNNDFIESHTALEDVEIEVGILAAVLREGKDLETFPRNFPSTKVSQAYKIWKCA